MLFLYFCQSSCHSCARCLTFTCSGECECGRVIGMLVCIPVPDGPGSRSAESGASGSCRFASSKTLRNRYCLRNRGPQARVVLRHQKALRNRNVGWPFHRQTLPPQKTMFADLLKIATFRGLVFEGRLDHKMLCRMGEVKRFFIVFDDVRIWCASDHRFQHPPEREDITMPCVTFWFFERTTSGADQSSL